MPDNQWTPSTCRPEVWIYGVPGEGAYAWTAARGSYWVTGGVYQAWRSQGFECGVLGWPIKAAGWVAEMNYGRGCPGQWFSNGAVGYHDGAWRIMYGQYGQMGLMARLGRRLRRPPEHVLLRCPLDRGVEPPPVPPLLAAMKALVA